MFVQEWINSVQSFEEGFNAVNPIYFDGKFLKLYKYLRNYNLHNIIVFCNIL